MSEREFCLQGGEMAEAVNEFSYMSGFENTHSTEAVRGALPVGRNSPQKPPFGLFAEQVSGTAFTAPRAANKRSWLYRIRPSVKHGTGFQRYRHKYVRTAPCRDESGLPAVQLRWRPPEMPKAKTDFLQGLRTVTTCGDAWVQAGMAAHVYLANRSMERRYFMNADGEMLILPQKGAIRVATELGLLLAAPGEIIVIPRGLKFKVDLVDGPIRGYICENYGTILTLPERGPIGANHLANSRDFLFPAAAYEDHEGPCEVNMKWQGALHKTTLNHSPLDVVAWHGNYAPYKYDLRRFGAVGSISFDHPDPSIFTVLSSASDTPGTANVDFVIFPERWLVMEDTFRPPWYHLNCMSEFMGLLYGVYDAKPGGFAPGGMSLHNAMIPHGPDAEAFDQATNRELAPEKLADTLAFMFETRFVQSPTAYASKRQSLDLDYPSCWDGISPGFNPPAAQNHGR